MDEMRIITEDGVGLHVELDGDPAGPHTVLFVNGINTGLIYWGHQRATLADLGRMVLFDHRGHGRSDEPAAGRATVAQLGRDIGTVIDAIASERPVVIVAHSLGGMAVSALAEQRPELFGRLVAGVALLDCVPRRWGAIALRLPDFVVGSVVRMLWWAIPPLRRLLTDTSERRHRELTGRRTAPSSYAPFVSLRRARRLIASLRTMTLLSLLADVSTCDHSAGLPVLGRARVLVIAGAEDRMIPLRHKVRAAAWIPGAELVIVADAGHLSSIVKPACVDGHLRAFISALPVSHIQLNSQEGEDDRDDADSRPMLTEGGAGHARDPQS
ncbi:alpha/beta fold hydrolase [Nocardia exalbida]|uniref:alpha/beta fold hydrolase n=1 Tax=Nocardia exalbida TaxID=290231 RepID=UPI00030DB983|nr:alpha/beta hydrolase [Nocardia exalbida]